MRIDDYRFINSRDTVAGGEKFRALARAGAFAAERLRLALEEFARTDTELAWKVVEAGEIEIYLVPPRYVLRGVPDAAALILVNHAVREIEIVDIRNSYGGYDEETQWQEIKEIALAVAEAARRP